MPSATATRLSPASTLDIDRFHKERVEKWPSLTELRKAIAGTTAFKEADSDAVVAYYRMHFRPAFARSDDYEKLILRMQARFIEQGKKGILKSRAVEDRLMKEAWASPSGYDLHPKLKSRRWLSPVITTSSLSQPSILRRLFPVPPGDAQRLRPFPLPRMSRLSARAN